jgi:hypothetical protein
LKIIQQKNKPLEKETLKLQTIIKKINVENENEKIK